MPYRAAIESVLHRCDELCARIEKLRRVTVERERCETLAAALIWEARLRARVTRLEADRIEDDAFAPVTSVAESEAAAPNPAPLVLFAVIGVMVAIGVVAAFALLSAKHEVHVGRFALLGGNVVYARPPAHVGDRCTVRIDGDGDACEIDAICPTVEKRWREDHCVIQGQLSFTTEEAGTVVIALDAWR